MEQMIEQKIKI